MAGTRILSCKRFDLSAGDIPVVGLDASNYDRQLRVMATGHDLRLRVDGVAYLVLAGMEKDISFSPRQVLSLEVLDEADRAGAHCFIATIQELD